MEFERGFSLQGRYTFDSHIGSGSFATVWSATHNVVKSKVAVKIFPKAGISTDDSQTRFVREVSLLKRLDHPFIAEFFELLEDSSNYYAVQEFVENGNMLDFVNSQGKLNESVARKYFCQIISAVEYLHNNGVCHRDLKAENILLDRYRNIRVIDFGLSNTFTEDKPDMSTACGSPAYAAPEMIKGRKYSKEADIFSCGVLLYAIACGELPFDDDNPQRLFQKIVYTEPKYPTTLSAPLIDLLKKLLDKNPSTRITMEKIKLHPWFSQNEYAEVLSKQFKNTSKWFIAMPVKENLIDPDILNQLRSYNVDTTRLHQDLFGSVITEYTAMYRLLRKEKITESMKDLIFTNPITPSHSAPKPLQIPKFTAGKKNSDCPLPVAPKIHMSGRRDSTRENHSSITVPNVVTNQRRSLPKVSPLPIASRRLSRPNAVPKTLDFLN